MEAIRGDDDDGDGNNDRSDGSGRMVVEEQAGAWGSNLPGARLVSMLESSILILGTYMYASTLPMKHVFSSL